MRIDRRKALGLIGLAAGGTAAAKTPAGGAVRFLHGVASGDPRPDGVILWTRATRAESPVRGEPVALTWEVATDEQFGSIAARGVTTADAARDYTAKVDVRGLKPATSYFYRFRAADDEVSPVGRARTLPVGAIQDVVLAIASCTLYPNGYFNAYRAIADLPRVDAVVHLGDYIYEYGGPKSYGMNSAVAGERPHDPPHECVSLADYRRRHAQYKADPDTQAAHARAPWIVVWDDHETCNDSYSTGGENHQPATEGDWATRKAAALKAYFEWMPIREPAPGVSMAEAANRSFVFGDLASLIMLETRLVARGKQLDLETDMPTRDGKPDVAAFKAKLADPNRRMMSPRQEAWVEAELARSVKSGHAWQVLGNQVVMARVKPFGREALKPEELAKVTPAAQRRLAQREPFVAAGVPFTLDMWDGYPADRERLYGLIRRAGARPIVVSGDSHSFWANDLHDDAGRRVACEFGATGVTSPGAGEAAPGLDYGALVARVSPEVRYNNQLDQGFVLLTLTRGEARADMIAVSTITSRQFQSATRKRFVVRPEGAGVSAVAEA